VFATLFWPSLIFVSETSYHILLLFSASNASDDWIRTPKLRVMGATTFNTLTLSIIGLIATHSIDDTQNGKIQQKH
jgi:hypothetical protein